MVTETDLPHILYQVYLPASLVEGHIVSVRVKDLAYSQFSSAISAKSKLHVRIDKP